MAVTAALEARKHRRLRTLIDFRYFSKRIMSSCPELSGRYIRNITSRECSEYISRAFHTPHQQRKARSILSGIFSTACKYGWSDSNPITNVDIPTIKENRTHILSSQEIEMLKKSSTVL